MATSALATALQESGDLEGARQTRERAIDLTRRTGHRRGQAVELGNMAALLQDLGQLGEAMNMYELQFPIAREVGDRRGEAIGRLNLAALLSSLGDMDAARDYLEKSLAIFEELDAKYPQSYVHHGLGTIAWQQRRWDEAVAHLETALEMRREFEFVRDIAESLRILGVVHIEQGDNERAELRLGEAVEVALWCGTAGRPRVRSNTVPARHSRACHPPSRSPPLLSFPMRP